MLIYGIDEDQDHKATAVSAIDGRDFSKEWLEQVIQTRIHPHIQGLAIYPVTIESGRVCYIVSIPQSFTAHQAHDHRYYKRFNFESVAMEDYEVRQTMNRRQWSTYRVDLFKNLRHEGGQSFVTVKAVIENTSEVVGEKVSLVLFAPTDLVNENHKSMAHGPRIFEEVSYLGLSAGGMSTIAPLTKHHIAFSNFPVRLPKGEAKRFDLVARVYDEHGLANETTFKVSSDDGKIKAERVVERESAR